VQALFGSQAKQAIDQLLQQLTDRIAANDRYDASAEGELDVLKAVVENMSPEQRRKAGALSELEQLRRKERDQMLEQQLKDRAELLDKLEHQPQWVSWAAAFFGSVTSTLIMHPIDTLKIRLIANDGKDGEDDADGPFPPARTTPPALGLDDAPAAAALALSDPLGLDPLGLDPLGSALGEAASGVGQALDGAFSQGAGEGAEPAAAGVAVMARGSVTLDRAVAAPAAAAAAASKGPESLLSLYDGILPNILKEAPSSALYLGIYELFRTFLSSHTALSPLPIYLLAGGMGEAVASIFRVPSETVKTRVQTGDDAMSALKAVFMDPKVRGNAIRSWSASLTRDVPMGAIQIALFEIIKTLILESPDIDFDISTLGAEALLGAFGGAVGAFVTTPSDVLTTRIITQPEGQEEGPVAMLKRLSDEGGPGALWVGALERTLYWAPAIGIFLSVYCSLRQTALQIM
jgi:solute carrier family 25 S-adenosylmethionine transporter 26